jgi:hypothetical protein
MDNKCIFTDSIPDEPSIKKLIERYICLYLLYISILVHVQCLDDCIFFHFSLDLPFSLGGRRGRDLQLHMHQCLSSADVVSSNLDQGEVYNIM